MNFTYFIIHNMKKMILTFCAVIMCFSGMAQVPVYLDETKPLEERVQDALSRMTLEEKVNMCYAQSKFSSPGVPRLGIPELWMTDGLMECAKSISGAHGAMPDGLMTHAPHSLH